MQCRFDPAIRTTHLGHGIFECVLLTGPDPRRALWPAVMSTAQTGRTHGCSDHCCKVKILLANPEPMVWTPPLPGGGIPERQPLKGECHADRSYWIGSRQIYF